MMRHALVADSWRRNADTGNVVFSQEHSTSAAEASAKPPRVLILSVSAGAGHVRAAQAICAHATALNAAVHTTHWDVMDCVPPAFRKVYTDCYIKLASEFPAVWGSVYRKMDNANPDSMLQQARRFIERMQARALLKKIAELKPDAIVCTHFFPAEVLAYARSPMEKPCPVWVLITDFDLHRIWLQPRVTGYFVANEEVAFRMRAHGVEGCAIHVAGLPIMPAFTVPPPRRSCAQELGVDPDRKTLLLMGGGFGLGKLDGIAERLLAVDHGIQLLVLAGKNAQLLRNLESLAALYPGRLFPQGYTAQVERFMSCADMIITKSGGLTSAECLAMGLPMIVIEPIPGQEERNADFLVEQGVALKAVDMDALEYRVRHLLDRPAKMKDMRARARALGRPDAARRIIETVLQHLNQ